MTEEQTNVIYQYGLSRRYKTRVSHRCDLQVRQCVLEPVNEPVWNRLNLRLWREFAPSWVWSGETTLIGKPKRTT